MIATYITMYVIILINPNKNDDHPLPLKTKSVSEESRITIKGARLNNSSKFRYYILLHDITTRLYDKHTCV